jgi:hypothetical protein
MSYPKSAYTKLPEGWKKCLGKYQKISTATKMANIWNNRRDEYYYKIFPKFNNKETCFIIARKLKKEIDK